MAEAERDLWRPPGATPLLKDHIGLVAQEHVQMAFEYHQKGKLHTVQGCAGVGRDRVNFLVACMRLCFGWNEWLIFQFVQITSCPVTGNHWGEHVFLFFFFFIHIDKIHPTSTKHSLLQAEWSQLFPKPLLIGEMLQSLHHLCDSSLDSLHYVHVSLHWGPRIHSMCGLTSAEERGKIMSLSLLRDRRIPLPQDTISLFCCKGTIGSASVGVHEDPNTVKLISSWVSPSMYWCMVPNYCS